MANEAQVSLTGYVATQPSFWTTTSGAAKVTMRVAWTPRHIDRVTGEWTDGNTSYVTVVCWRKLADNVALCVRKGDPVVVKGRLSVRPYEKDGISRIVVEVDASSVGHDMSRGAAHFQRTKRAPGETAAGQLATGFGTGGLPGDEGLRGGNAVADPDGGGIGAESQTAGAGTGAAESVPASGADGEPGEDMFDESAIAALAEEPGPVSAPF
jgi:single-strand DNA-binding protein